MSQLFKIFFDICLFRARPQDLPASSNLLISTVVVALIALIIQNRLLSFGNNLIVVAGLQIIFLGISLRFLLGIFSKPERWLQSATALYGCSAIFSSIIIPFLAVAGANAFETTSISTVKLIIVFTDIWHFGIIVYILKQSLEVSLAFAFVISLVVELAIASVLLQLFGGQML